MVGAVVFGRLCEAAAKLVIHSFTRGNNVNITITHTYSMK